VPLKIVASCLGRGTQARHSSLIRGSRMVLSAGAAQGEPPDFRIDCDFCPANFGAVKARSSHRRYTVDRHIPYTFHRTGLSLGRANRSAGA